MNMVDATNAKKWYGFHVLCLHLYVVTYLQLLPVNVSYSYIPLVAVQFLWYFFIVFLGMRIYREAKDGTFLVLAWLIPAAAYFYGRLKGLLSLENPSHRQ